VEIVVGGDQIENSGPRIDLRQRKPHVVTSCPN